MANELKHQKFLERVDESQLAVYIAGRWLQRLGHHIIMPPYSHAESHADWREHADNGDLHVASRWEVKHHSYPWKSLETWTHDDFIVCSRHTYDQAKVKPRGYIYLNRDMTHAAVVFADTVGKWETRDNWDPNLGKKTECYVCKPGDVKHWCEIKL